MRGRAEPYLVLLLTLVSAATVGVGLAVLTHPPQPEATFDADASQGRPCADPEPDSEWSLLPPFAAAAARVEVTGNWTLRVSRPEMSLPPPEYELNVSTRKYEVPRPRLLPCPEVRLVELVRDDGRTLFAEGRSPSLEWARAAENGSEEPVPTFILFRLEPGLLMVDFHEPRPCEVDLLETPERESHRTSHYIEDHYPRTLRFSGGVGCPDATVTLRWLGVFGLRERL